LNDPYFIIIRNLVNLMIHEQMTHHILYFLKNFPQPCETKKHVK